LQCDTREKGVGEVKARQESMVLFVPQQCLHMLGFVTPEAGVNAITGE
jgi:hypothetical protein